MSDLTEERIREIVREEIQASIMRGAIRPGYVDAVADRKVPTRNAYWLESRVAELESQLRAVHGVTKPGYPRANVAEIVAEVHWLSADSPADVHRYLSGPTGGEIAAGLGDREGSERA